MSEDKKVKTEADVDFQGRPLRVGGVAEVYGRKSPDGREYQIVLEAITGFSPSDIRRFTGTIHWDGKIYPIPQRSVFPGAAAETVRQEMLRGAEVLFSLGLVRQAHDPSDWKGD